MQDLYIDGIARRVESALGQRHRPKAAGLALYRLYALLVLVKGEDVSLENVHDAWSVWMASIDPHHDALVPFSSLDEATRLKDMPYVRAIAAVAREMNGQVKRRAQ